MAEREQLPFLTNCKLTINSKITSGGGRLYKLLTNELKFKIVGCDPLVIEKDYPSLDDIEQVFYGIRSLCGARESSDQTVKADKQCNEHDVTNSISLPQTKHMIGDLYQLVDASNSTNTRDVTHETSCKESKSNKTEVSENLHLLEKGDIISDTNIPLHGTGKEKQNNTGQRIETESGEKLIAIVKEEIQRLSEMFDESLLSHSTSDATNEETDKQLIEESARDDLTQMSGLKESNFKEFDQANKSNISREDTESNQEKLKEDKESSLHDSTSTDSENIEHVPAGYSLEKLYTEGVNSLSVDNKLSDVLQTTSASSEDYPQVLGRADNEGKMIQDNGNYETEDKLHQNEAVVSNKSSKLNWNETADIQNMGKIQIEQQSQDIHQGENATGCSTQLKSASQRTQHVESETVCIPEMPTETNMSEESCTFSKEITSTKKDDLNLFSSPVVSDTCSNNKSGFCVVTDVRKLNIKIYKADITELEVDCIVNAANKDLMHIGGVARAISDAAGSALWRECDNYTKDGGVLDVTGIFVTTGGNLFAQYVIHAVGPMWDSYDRENKRQCFTDLRRTVIKCLVEANRRGVTSIAFPSISAAIFRVPKEHCARCYMEAVKHFDILSVGDRLTLREIHFVDVDAAMVDIIVDCFSSNWYKLSDIEIVLQDADFVDEHLKSVSKNDRKDCHSSTDEEIKCTKDKSTLSSVRTQDMAGAAALVASKSVVNDQVYSSKLNRDQENVNQSVATLTTSKCLVDQLSHNQDCSGKLNRDQENVNQSVATPTTSKTLVDQLNHNQESSGMLKKDKSNVSQSPAALDADDETYAVSAAYQLGTITLHIESGHAFEIKSDVTFTVGKSFDKLSASQDFSISTGLKLCKTVRSQENKYTYFNVTELGGSHSRFLCEVFPEPDEVEKITEVLGNLETAVKICKQLPKTLIITSSVLYTDSSTMQLQKGDRNNLHMKNVARFAFSLYDFLEKLSKEAQEISVFVVGSEDSLPIIVKVIESHNVEKVIESHNVEKVIESHGVKAYPTGDATAHTDVADTVNTNEVTVKAGSATTEHTGAGTTINRDDTVTVNTDDSITANIDDDATVPTGAAATMPTGAAPTVPTGAAATVPTGAAATVPTGAAATVPTGAAATVPTGTAVTVPTGAAATVPTGAAVTVPTGAAATLPTGAAATVPTGAAATVQTGAAATLPTGAAATVPTGAAATVQTGAAATVPTGAAATVPTGAAATIPTRAAVTVPTGAAATVPTGAAANVPTGADATVPTGAAAPVNTGNAPVSTSDAIVLKGAIATIHSGAAATVNTGAVATVLAGAAAAVNAKHACDFCYDNTLCQRVTCCEKWLCQDCEQSASACPFCQKPRKIITGNQPPGSMTVDLIDDYADGFENDHVWEIEYYFPDGIQKDCHPHPGKPYDSVIRTAYLPANSYGYQVLVRLRLAFIRNLIFTIGHSESRNKDDVIIWNGISHKTSLHGKKYGYPDPDYLSRVTLELSTKGVQLSVLTPSENEQLSKFVRCIKQFNHFSDLE